LIEAARELGTEAARLTFSDPVVCVYNPLIYAWKPHEEYLRRFGTPPKRVVFLGMNPGPFGMAQTGIPFGEIGAVRDWMGITAPVEMPLMMHPKRPVLGFDCARSEISGQRLWKLFADRFGSPQRFFKNHLVVNYCPLAFVECTGRNRTPDKLPAAECEPLFRICDKHLLRVLGVVRPEWLIGIGGFAAERAHHAAQGATVRIGRILHPSPASPAANRHWALLATEQLRELGVWD
jgi:single-strand selective monofunctional uracil DNA glycosylase